MSASIRLPENVHNLVKQGTTNGMSEKSAGVGYQTKKVAIKHNKLFFKIFSHILFYKICLDFRQNIYIYVFIFFISSVLLLLVISLAH